MNVYYNFADPSGNCTVLVDASKSNIPYEMTLTEDGKQTLAFLGTKLLAAESEAEQVGFVFPEKKFLYMAGGEFCGNASLCAGAYIFSEYRHLCSTSLPVNICLKVSGNDELCLITVEKGAANEAARRLEDGRELQNFRCSLTLSKAPAGINHHVVMDRLIETEEEKIEAEKTIVKIAEQEGNSATGMLFVKEWKGFSEGKGKYTMFPLVYVPEIGTMCWESSCASGTIAAAVSICKENSRMYGRPLSFEQPGGTLKVTVMADGAVQLRNTVLLSKERMVEAEIK